MPLALIVLAAAAIAHAAPHVPSAQPPRYDSTTVTVAGRGPTTYVLVSGIVGGVAGFRRLRAQLVDRGHRVVVIDPYRLSLDSADVTFAALARRTDAVLAGLAVDSARVVGHAHGAGVALRLASCAPSRVSALHFLDVGALAENRTKVFSSSLRLAPYIARIGWGRSFIRRRFVQGLRENAGTTAWLDAATQRAYTDPFLDGLPRAVDLAGRLSRAREPEPVPAVVARVRVPITIILGSAPHPSAPDADELDALAPLGPLLRVERLAGVGHFPHEEATAAVAGRLVAPAPGAPMPDAPLPAAAARGWRCAAPR